jgi:UDP-N-acetylglucosamine:LPS N-acetylglucosamine transferase
VGGYASGPVLRSAARMGIPTLLQEQNSYAGVTIKLLAKKATKICVAYKTWIVISERKNCTYREFCRNFVISDALNRED